MNSDQKVLMYLIQSMRKLEHQYDDEVITIKDEADANQWNQQIEQINRDVVDQLVRKGITKDQFNQLRLSNIEDIY